MTRFLLAAILILSSLTSSAQDFIGMNEHKVRKAMAGMKTGFSHGDKTETEKYRFLRFVSNDERETWIIFFDEDGLCKGVRITCDNSMADTKRKELNDLYLADGVDKWVHYDEENTVKIDMRTDSWSVTITYLRVNKTEQSGNV